MTGQPDDPIVRLLSSLIEGHVEFIVVGGAAATQRPIGAAHSDDDPG